MHSNVMLFFMKTGASQNVLTCRYEPVIKSWWSLTSEIHLVNITHIKRHVDR